MLAQTIRRQLSKLNPGLERQTLRPRTLTAYCHGQAPVVIGENIERIRRDEVEAKLKNLRKRAGSCLLYVAFLGIFTSDLQGL